MRRLTPGKQKGLEAISDKNGIILATAMDQRGSLGKMISSLNQEISYQDGLTRFKKGVSEILGNRSSSLLLDPEYGWEAAEKLNKDIGLIMAYEKTGYDTTSKGRLPNLVDHYAVSDLARKGVHALKLLVYYDPDEDEVVNSIKKTFIKRVGDECRQNDLLFILEPVSYSEKGLPAKSPEFAKVKPGIIEYFMEEFSKECYGIDLLKVEVPVAIYHIEGYSRHDDAHPVFSADEAAQFYRRCSEKSEVPFIYLSGGVTNEQFIDTLYFAKEAQSRFCGCLCGRAIWQDGVKPFAEKGEKAFYQWLETKGLANLNNVLDAVKKTAIPWKA
ncbi:tagatose 1,6-diphosphate aldolase [Thermoactinomyces mirandus]|uniref:Tagatose 1,6-diphosphate aldolase n=1 Tax=Thermoactinomyces mirandus TaxID=2756294 RepID=A0A7W2ARG6_9BACL|nr:tagatose 1,6-diphosphate aldolase [Thermoactinomyces mirandus]MBA4602332.1 tagatose 1,6-diphosphate aldolase [Thermoactinomyces mirandus]